MRRAQILADEKKARKKARKARENAEAEGEETEEQRNARNTNKWIGSRLYDSSRGITCHQCRCDPFLLLLLFAHAHTHKRDVV
jgi:hypothetical protein